MKIHKSAILEQACSKDKSRYVLMNPYIDRSEPGRPVAVATTGQIMAIVPVHELADGEHGFLPVAVLKAARKLKCGTIDACEITFDGENSRTFKLWNGAVLPDDVKTDMKYPNWRQVLPDKDRESVIKVSLNPTLLAQLAEAMGAGEGITLEIAADNKPVVVRPSYYSVNSRAIAPTIPDAFGVIMPITQPKKDEPAAKTSADVPAYVS